MHHQYRGPQGFDAMIASSSVGAMRFGNTPYSASVNVDPDISGPIAIELGEETSIVKSVRLASVTTPESWQTIEKYVMLTVLASTPANDAYPPSASALTKTLWRRNSLQLNALRSLTLPASFISAYTDVESILENIPDDLGAFGVFGEQLRRFRLDVALGTSTSNYSADLAPHYAAASVMLHSNAITTEDQLLLIDRIVRFGIHLHGLVSRGWGDLADISAGAGQHFALHPWLYVTGFLLGSESILQSAKTINTSMNANTIWVPASYVGRPAFGKSSIAAQTFFEEQVGVPFMIPDEFGSNHDTRYGVIASGASGEELLPIMLLRNGPGGVTGAAAILNGGASDLTNPRASCIAHMARLRSWSPWVMSAANPGVAWRDLYDLVQPLSGLTEWAGPPDQPPYGDATAYNDDWFSAGVGAISWNFTNLDYSTETVTSRDFRYSLDNVQWVVVAGVNLTGTQSSLVKGAAHYCGYRQTSASGSSPWSANYDRAAGGVTPRGRFTPTGTDSATAPTFTTTPAIHARVAPDWNQELWYPVSGELLDSEVQLGGFAGSSRPRASTRACAGQGRTPLADGPLPALRIHVRRRG